MISSQEGPASSKRFSQTGWLAHTLRTCQQDGLGRSLWRISRRLFSPALQMEAYFLFDTSLAEPAPTNPQGQLRVRIYHGIESLAPVQANFASIGLTRAFEQRFHRGEAVAIASEGNCVAGFAWLAFADMPVEEFQMIISIPPAYVCHYDAFVLPGWRGRGVVAAMIKEAKQFARDQGCQRSLSWINVLNVASLRLTQRWNRRPAMTIIYLRLRGFARPVRFALGQPLGTRFRKA
jgi:GNAT superfamily N-acetyltransferase